MSQRQDLDLGAIERHYDNLTADYRIERVQAVANCVIPLIAEVRKLKLDLAQTVSIEYLTAREEALLAEIAQLKETQKPYSRDGIEFCGACGTALGDEDDVTWEDEGS